MKSQQVMDVAAQKADDASLSSLAVGPICVSAGIIELDEPGSVLHNSAHAGV